MEHLYGFKWNYKSIGLFITIIALPNILGFINIPTIFGFKIHFFQIALFLAAAIYGLEGGLIAGLLGSMYSAMIMNNPYILIGNAILGLFTGYFFKKGFHLVTSVLIAFLIQIPWLILTDYYLVGISMKFISFLLISLTISNLLFATLIHYTHKYVLNLTK